MNTTVYLIRHGAIDNPQNILYGRNIDVKLNDVGKEQIRKLAQRMKKSGEIPGKIYASPLSRAVDSAKILAEILGIEYVVENDLVNIDIPALAGKPMEIRNKIHQSGIDEYGEEYVSLGNEARDHVVERMKKAFAKAAKENTGKSAAIVSHGDPIQFLLYAITNPNKEILPMNVLVNQNYPEKGSAVKLVIDENMNFVKKETI